MAKILIADDDEDIRDLLELKFTGSGHEVHSACDGREAVDMCLDLEPDLMVLDLNMPFLDGLQVIAEVRRTDRVATTPIVMLTAMSGDADVEAGLSAGADEYVTKPFSPASLSNIVHGILDGRAGDRSA